MNNIPFQFPLSLLLTANASEVQIEVKSGDTFNGKLLAVDKFMNAKLADVKQASKDGLQFHSLKELLIKGSSIKYFRLQQDTLAKAVQEAEAYNQQREEQQKQRQKKQQQYSQKTRGRGKERGRGRP